MDLLGLCIRSLRIRLRSFSRPIISPISRPILILITTRKVVYVAWMLIYLLALPVWNLILPVYAFWHFDDFSWGETR